GWYPKLATTWQPHPRIALRATWFESLQRPLLAQQTLEPTQLGEFNQFIDDPEGTEAEQYGVGFDIDAGAGHRLGALWLRRRPDIPYGEQVIETEQKRGHLYWSWSAAPWAANLGYHYEQSENRADVIENLDVALVDVPSRLTTWR